MRRLLNKWCVGLVFFIILNTAAKQSFAQTPFDCSGRMFRVVEQDGGTAFEEIKLFSETQAVDFESLAFMPNVSLNGICYRPKDHLIYGLELGETYQLVQIDANYRLRTLKELPLPNQFLFVSGDISPDGRYLVLLGFSPQEDNNLLAMVDLEDPDYHTELSVLGTSTSGEAIFCADVAFHPTTGTLFGFDHREGRLLKIDIDRQLIDDQTYPTTDNLRGNMPSIFFNAEGRLFGIAAPNNQALNRTFYEFDIAKGTATNLQQLGIEFNQDACSCPFEVNFYNRVSTRKAFPCTSIQFTISIVNQSPFVQRGLQLRDTFQSGIEIESIRYPNFSGRIQSGIGSNILALDGFDVPIGTDSIEVLLRVPPSVEIGTFTNQAYLYNVNTDRDGPPEMRISDDPETAQVQDPTYYEVRDLEVNFEEEFPVLCPGETLSIDVGIEGAQAYKWSTGANTSTIEVSQPGIYDVEVTTGCGSVTGSIYVDQDDLRLDLGDAIKEAEEGAWLGLSPDVNSFSDIQSYYWTASDDQIELACWTCSEVEVPAQEGVSYYVAVTNENGCQATDSLRVNVRPFSFFAPTAFSPDGNGQNDQFLLFGKKDFTILNFSVYNRWGARVYFQEDGKANDPNFGWDGFYQGQLANTGVYIWGAKVQTENGQIKQLSGEINLIR